MNNQLITELGDIETDILSSITNGYSHTNCSMLPKLVSEKEVVACMETICKLGMLELVETQVLKTGINAYFMYNDNGYLQATVTVNPLPLSNQTLFYIAVYVPDENIEYK